MMQCRLIMMPVDNLTFIIYYVALYLDIRYLKLDMVSMFKYQETPKLITFPVHID